MAGREEILEIISGCIDELAEQTPPDRRIDASADTVLLGEGGKLDSLGLVTLIVSIEERISARLGRRVELLDLAVGGSAPSPLRTVGSLVDHVASSA